MNTPSVPKLCAVIFLIGLLSSLGPVAAENATPAAATAVLPPEAEVTGLGLAEWSARSWQWFFSFPPDVNPFSDDTGARCGYGQAGAVFFLAGAEGSVERSCVIPAGVHLFVPLLGSECSTVEPPPFFGQDEAELNRCATDAIEMAERAFDMSTMRLTVDGQAIVNLSTYRTVTPLFTLWLPEDNLLGSDERVAGSVADGYQVMLNPLPEGEHEMIIELPGPGTGQTITITYRLTVVANVAATASPIP